MSVVTGQAPVTLELRNTPGGKTQTNQKWHTHSVGICVGLCLRASLMYDVYDCIESTEMVD